MQPMSPKQTKELGSKLVQMMPDDLDHDQAQAVIDSPETLREFLGGLRALHAIPPYPAVGEIFELTLDGDAPENQPLEMVSRDGYDHPELWSHNGERVVGVQTRRFKLVEVGFCKNLDEVKEKLAPHGTIPEGQWREAFKKRFRKPDGKGPIGFADSSWVDPRAFVYFPFVDADGGSLFYWADYDFYADWRWLVGVRK